MLPAGVFRHTSPTTDDKKLCTGSRLNDEGDVLRVSHGAARHPSVALDGAGRQQLNVVLDLEYWTKPATVF